jgi:hypothetical protein
MPVAVWHEVEDVDAALARLGLRRAPLLRAVQAGYLARISRTENDAPIAWGFYQWNETLRTLREELVVQGWLRDDNQGYSTVENPERTIAIAVSSGDAGTGQRWETPRTKRSKGPRTAEAVIDNAAQLDLFPETLAVPTPAPGDHVTWILLFYCDGNQLRAELSLPVSMDANGHIELWRERIILPSQPVDSSISVPEPDFGPEVEIDIQRRA